MDNHKSLKVFSSDCLDREPKTQNDQGKVERRAGSQLEKEVDRTTVGTDLNCGQCGEQTDEGNRRWGERERAGGRGGEER